MTRQEVRKEMAWMCGCGSPADAYRFIRDVLAIHPLYDHQDELKGMLPDYGLQYFVLYVFSDKDWTEHGGSVGGGWLTDKGKALLEALQREADDDFDVISAAACIHGYAADDDHYEECPECSKL